MKEHNKLGSQADTIVSPFLRGARGDLLSSSERFIVDFYCAALKLVIEIDGDSHFTEEGKEYDEERTKVLEGYGLRVLRFTNEEVMNCFESVCEEIENLIPPTPLFKGG